MRQTSIILLAIILSSCSAKLIMPTETDANHLSAKYPGTSLSQLNEGKILYETKCTQCHKAKRPDSKSEEKWKMMVPDMANKAKKNGKTQISEEEQTLILKYLVAMRDQKK